MKKILYFIVGLLYLPIMTIARVVEYITNLGEILINNIRLIRRWKRL
jgi:hypothetical protein